MSETTFKTEGLLNALILITISQASLETRHNSPPKTERLAVAEQEDLGLEYKSWPVLEKIINISEAMTGPIINNTCLIELGGFDGTMHAECLALGLGGRRPWSAGL